MIKLIILMTFQSLFLVLAQISLKFGINRLTVKISFTIAFISDVISNYLFWLTGLSMILSAIIWIYVLKNYQFNLAYPLVSISYVFALIAAILFFNESVPIIRWIGVGVIIVGLVLITHK